MFFVPPVFRTFEKDRGTLEGGAPKLEKTARLVEASQYVTNHGHREIAGKSPAMPDEAF